MIRLTRHKRILMLHAELHGVIQGACNNVDAGRWTAEQALAAIREKSDAVNAATRAEFADGAR